MKNKGLVAVGFNQAGEVRLLDRWVDVGVLVVLKDPEVSVQADVNARWLDELRSVRVELYPPGLDLGLDVTIREKHEGNLSLRASWHDRVPARRRS